MTEPVYACRRCGQPLFAGGKAALDPRPPLSFLLNEGWTPSYMHPDCARLEAMDLHRERALRKLCVERTSLAMLHALKAVVGSGQLPPNGPTLATVKAAIALAEGEH